MTIASRWHWRYPVQFGLGLGIIFGVWDLVATALDPLGDDSPSALLIFYGPMFAAWGCASFVAVRRTALLRDGLLCGAIAAFATFVVFDLFAIVRANLFLNILTQRADWQNLTANYPGPTSGSFRAYITRSYISGAPFKIFVATLIGVATGLIGGGLARLWRGHPLAPHGSDEGRNHG